MRIEIVCLTKPDGYFTEAIREYEKRLQSYCKISLRIQNGVKNSGKASDSKGIVLHVDKNGNRITSIELAEIIKRCSISAPAGVTIITDACSTTATDQAQSICISQMDMDERLTVVILYEQIYRAYRILKGEPYHK